MTPAPYHEKPESTLGKRNGIAPQLTRKECTAEYCPFCDEHQQRICIVLDKLEEMLNQRTAKLQEDIQIIEGMDDGKRSSETWRTLHQRLLETDLFYEMIEKVRNPHKEDKIDLTITPISERIGEN
jgi:signal recognition particle GTPase